MSKKTKVCTVCNRTCPSTTEYFHIHSKNRLRAICKECRCAKRSGKPIEIEEVKPLTKIEKSKKYIITYAQNATPVHEGFISAIETYAKAEDAQIVVIAGRYQNPTSVWTKDMAHSDWWAGRVVPYIFGGVHAIGAKLAVFGDISIQPTAVRPLTGFEGHVSHKSGIFGHPKQELRTVATDKRAWPRILASTGACTVPNYTKSKAGKKGEKWHTIGALIVEVSGNNRFYLRHVAARDDGSFQDLNRIYSKDGMLENQPVEALICGDLHVAHKANEVEQATFFADDSIVNTLKPKSIVYHDILSMRARPKYERSLRERYDAYFSGNDYVLDELDYTVKYVDQVTPEGTKGYVVSSNHDDHLLHWLDNASVRNDPQNALIYHQLWVMLLEDYHTRDDGRFSPVLRLWYNQVSESKRVTFLDRNDTLKLAGHTCSFHGHNGVDGSKGSLSQYAKLGVKTVIGHSHSPGIQDHCMQVGVTSSLDQGYNQLPSSWFHAHGLLYPDGKRTLLFVVDGKWKA